MGVFDITVFGNDGALDLIDEMVEESGLGSRLVEQLLNAPMTDDHLSRNWHELLAACTLVALRVEPGLLLVSPDIIGLDAEVILPGGREDVVADAAADDDSDWRARRILASWREQEFPSPALVSRAQHVLHLLPDVMEGEDDEPDPEWLHIINVLSSSLSSR